MTLEERIAESRRLAEEEKKWPRYSEDFKSKLAGVAVFEVGERSTYETFCGKAFNESGVRLLLDQVDDYAGRHLAGLNGEEAKRLTELTESFRQVLRTSVDSAMAWWECWGPLWLMHVRSLDKEVLEGVILRDVGVDLFGDMGPPEEKLGPYAGVLR